MLNISIRGESRTPAWYGPTQPRPFRYPVCVIDSNDPEHIEFAVNLTNDAAKRYDRDGMVVYGFEAWEDGLSEDEYLMREREAEAAERRFCQPREYWL